MIRPTSLDMKFLDQRKDGAMIRSQQLFEVFTILGPYLLFRLRHSPDAGERLVDLVIEIVAVSHNHKGPVSRDLAQYFLSEEDHRETFTAALSMPENAQPSLVLANGVDSFKRTIHAKILVVLRDNLPDIAACVAEQRKILHDVQ